MAAAVAALAASAFPAQAEVWNNTWRAHVEPETKVVIEPYKAALVTIADADQLARVVSNLEVLNAINEWTEPGGLYLRLPEAAAEAQTGGEVPADGIASTDAPPLGGGPAPDATDDAAPDAATVTPTPASASDATKAAAPGGKAGKK